MPDKNEDKPEESKMDVPESRTLTFVLEEDNRIFMVKGVTNPEVSEISYQPEVLRKNIQAKIDEVKKEFGTDTTKNAIFIIKPTAKSKYNNMVELLDEMAITQAKVYAIGDLTPKEIELVAQKKAENPTPAPTPAAPTK